MKKRLLVFLLGISAIYGAPRAFALEATTLHLDTETVARGYTLRTSDAEAVLAIGPGVLYEASDASLLEEEISDGFPEGYKVNSPVVTYSLTQALPAILSKPVFIGLKPTTPTLWKKALGYFDKRTQRWHLVAARRAGEHWGAFLPFPHVRVALFDQEGVLPRTTLTAQSAAVYDPNVQSYLLNYHADEERSIASITKLMTALVVADTNPDFSRVVTYKTNEQRPGAMLRINPGEKLTVGDLWHAMLLGSANNAAIALAHSTGLSDVEFLERMNARANAMGLRATNFADPSGLNSQNTSTARDIALLAATALEEPLLRATMEKSEYRFVTKGTRRAHRIKTTNELLGKDAAVVVGKTGYLDEAGYCFVVLSKRQQGLSLITVVLGSTTSSARFREAGMLVHLAD